MLRVCCRVLPVLLLGLGLASATAQEAIPRPAAAPAAAPPPPPANAVAATVNGQAIPELALFRATRVVPEAKRAEARAEILNYLIDNVLLDQHLRQQKVEVDAKAVDAEIAKMREQLKGANQDYDKVLKDMFLTEAELREHITAELRWDKYVSAQAGDAVLRDLFSKNPEMFDGSMVHARHILVTGPADAAKAQLGQLRTQLETAVTQALAKLPPNADNLARQKERARVLDESFAAVAKQHSACPSKEQGGDIGWFPRTGSMVEPFAKAAFALKPYELSDVVPTTFGHHLILCVERRAGKEVKFEDVREMVKDLYAARMREALVAQLRPAAKITK